MTRLGKDQNLFGIFRDSQVAAKLLVGIRKLFISQNYLFPKTRHHSIQTCKTNPPI